MDYQLKILYKEPESGSSLKRRGKPIWRVVSRKPRTRSSATKSRERKTLRQNNTVGNFLHHKIGKCAQQTPLGGAQITKPTRHNSTLECERLKVQSVGKTLERCGRLQKHFVPPTGSDRCQEGAASARSPYNNVTGLRLYEIKSHQRAESGKSHS